MKKKVIKIPEYIEKYKALCIMRRVDMKKVYMASHDGSNVTRVPLQSIYLNSSSKKKPGATAVIFGLNKKECICQDRL